MDKENLMHILKEHLNLDNNLHYITSLDKARQYFDAGGLCLLPIEIHGKLVLEDDKVFYRTE